MITAQKFLRSFEQVTQEQTPQLLHCWPGKPQFTQYVKNELMPSVASILGCYRELEYKRIDIVFKMLSVANAEPSNESEIIIAIEHENDFGKSHEEITKLCAFNASLGVLITYAGARNYQRLIAEFDKIVTAHTNQDSPSKRGEILVIFGPYGYNRPTNLSWDCFVHQGDGFVQLDTQLVSSAASQVHKADAVGPAL